MIYMKFLFAAASTILRMSHTGYPVEMDYGFVENISCSRSPPNNPSLRFYISQR